MADDLALKSFSRIIIETTNVTVFGEQWLPIPFSVRLVAVV